MPNARRISTIIATHDRPGLLVDALDSLAAQRLPPAEVIVVDDGSSADTGEAVRDWSRSTPARFLLRYVYQRNSGPAVARNRGLMESRGGLIHFMDDDDLLERDALLHLSAALPSTDAPAVSMASHALIDNLSATSDADIVAPATCRPAQRIAAMIAGHWFVPIHGYLFTRSALANTGFWDPQLGSQEDDEFLLRVAMAHVDFLPAPDALVWYRQHDGVRRASPHRPGTSLEQGLRQRLRDDLDIRERAARMLRERGVLDAYRSAFQDWHRRLLDRYGALVNEVADGDWTVLRWIAAQPGRAPGRDGLELQARPHQSAI